MKTFWQHTSGKVYAVESDTFGRITGGAGPFDIDELRDPSEYTCGFSLVQWITKAIKNRTLRRINPVLKQ